MEFPGKNAGEYCPFLSPRDVPNPGIKLGSPALQVDSLPSEPPGKPKNTGAGSLSLLQGYPPDSQIETGVSCITGRFFTSWATREVELPQIWKKLWFSQEVMMTAYWGFSDFSLISCWVLKLISLIMSFPEFAGVSLPTLESSYSVFQADVTNGCFFTLLIFLTTPPATNSPTPPPFPTFA